LLVASFVANKTYMKSVRSGSLQRWVPRREVGKEGTVDIDDAAVFLKALQVRSTTVVQYIHPGNSFNPPVPPSNSALSLSSNIRNSLLISFILSRIICNSSCLSRLSAVSIRLTLFTTVGLVVVEEENYLVAALLGGMGEISTTNPPIASI
jgi:hypothetical protein